MGSTATTTLATMEAFREGLTEALRSPREGHVVVTAAGLALRFGSDGAPETCAVLQAPLFARRWAERLAAGVVDGNGATAHVEEYAAYLRSKLDGATKLIHELTKTP